MAVNVSRWYERDIELMPVRLWLNSKQIPNKTNKGDDEGYLRTFQKIFLEITLSVGRGEADFELQPVWPDLYLLNAKHISIAVQLEWQNALKLKVILSKMFLEKNKNNLAH